jgi:hypothetical protein
LLIVIYYILTDVIVNRTVCNGDSCDVQAFSGKIQREDLNYPFEEILNLQTLQMISIQPILPGLSYVKKKKSNAIPVTGLGGL